MSDRNYIAEMDARIAGATSGSGWVAAIAAQKLHAELLETDPDLLDGWLHARAVDILRRTIGLRESSRSSAARNRAGARAFSDAADEAEATGDFSTLPGMFAIAYVIDKDETRKRAADMTGADHLFVAEHTYERDARQSMLLAQFHRAVAKKVGKRKTSDVFTEEQYEAMYLSVTRGAA